MSYDQQRDGSSDAFGQALFDFKPLKKQTGKQMSVDSESFKKKVEAMSNSSMSEDI